MRENAPVLAISNRLHRGVLFLSFYKERRKHMAEKQSNKDRIKEITAGIEQGIKELFAQ